MSDCQGFQVLFLIGKPAGLLVGPGPDRKFLDRLSHVILPSWYSTYCRRSTRLRRPARRQKLGEQNMR